MHFLRDENQVITISEIGGTITGWQYHGTDIFYPQQKVMIDGEEKARGGMHVCFPNFDVVAPEFGLPRHGTIRTRKADEVTENGILFRGRDMLGSAHDEECEVTITVTLEPKGFLYTLAARLLEPAAKDVFINPGLHPYFRTPEGDATVALPSGEEIFVGGPKVAMRYEEIGHEVLVSLPGIGGVQMFLKGSMWEGGVGHKVVLWRDSADYLCVEPVPGVAETYGKADCLRLTEEWVVLSCRFEIIL